MVPDGAVVQLIDPAGKTALEVPAETGNTWIKGVACNLPAGMYFLRLIEAGRVEAVGKVVVDRSRVLVAPFVLQTAAMRLRDRQNEEGRFKKNYII